MSEKAKTLTLAALALIAGLAGWTGCATLSESKDSEEERPPIVVYESSIEFEHGFAWKQFDGSDKKKWKPEHGKGRSVDKFHVIVVDRTGQKVYSATGKQVTIEYTLREGGAQTFTLTRPKPNDKHEPVLEATVPLDDSNAFRLKFDAAGAITAVRVDSRQLGSFSAAADIQVFVIPRH